MCVKYAHTHTHTHTRTHNRTHINIHSFSMSKPGHIKWNEKLCEFHNGEYVLEIDVCEYNSSLPWCQSKLTMVFNENDISHSICALWSAAEMMRRRSCNINKTFHWKISVKIFEIWRHYNMIGAFTKQRFFH